MHFSPMKLFSSTSIFFAFAFITCINGVYSNSEIEDSSYTKHCSSVIPPYNTTSRSDGDSLPSLSTILFTGGDRFQRAELDPTYTWAPKNLRLRLRPDHYQTTAAGVYKVEGFIHVTFDDDDDAPGGRPHLVIPMIGFWSEKSRKLCMVGSTPWEAIDLNAVLKLKFDDEENPTIYTAVVSGSLESTAAADDPTYFEPIQIFDFPASAAGYSYSLISEEIGAVFPSRKGESLSLDSTEFCSVMERGLLSLELGYAAECADRRCSPVGAGDGSSPENAVITSIQCAKGAKKARFFATFFNYSSRGYSSFAVSSTVIGEARWEGKNNRIIGVGCRILDPSLHWENPVGDCSIRLSLRQASVITMRNDGLIVGEIWSAKASEDSGYFSPINVSVSDDTGSIGLPEQQYEYTEMDRASKWCNNGAVKKKEAGNYTYPNPQSTDMRLNAKVKNGVGQELGSAYATPVWVGNGLFRGSVRPSVPQLRKPTMISYRIRMQPSFYHVDSNTNVSIPSLDWPATNPSGCVEMTAEGEYDAGNRHLCAVACRKLVAFRDCEVVLELDLFTMSGGRDSRVEGVIRSMRARTDPLHFDDLIIESAAYYQQGDAPSNNEEPIDYYLNQAEDLYSIGWVVLIPYGIIALALIVILQQRYACCCFPPPTFKEEDFAE